jgi:putative FmdB family regulatory protein
MPIYAYKCESCGFAKDVLQKMSDAPLTDCPTCGAVAFKKQLTAAGFQLKGSGWYATDFKGGSSGSSTSLAPSSSTEPSSKSPESAKPSEGTGTKTDSAPPSASGGCGSSCACH